MPFEERGLMREGSSKWSAWRPPGTLHRADANDQSGNVRPARLVRRLGFRLEGRSPRYLRIGGEWRDHDRYALTAEEWPAP